LLEPESDDGLVTWNVLDASLGAGKNFPISKVMQNVKLSCRVVNPDHEP
jgi:hypothetical protein